ncbi:hypothetical protein L2E82_34537, partial [Cichorium intybus]
VVYCCLLWIIRTQMLLTEAKQTRPLTEAFPQNRSKLTREENVVKTFIHNPTKGTKRRSDIYTPNSKIVEQRDSIL